MTPNSPRQKPIKWPAERERDWVETDVLTPAKVAHSLSAQCAQWARWLIAQAPFHQPGNFSRRRRHRSNSFFLLFTFFFWNGKKVSSSPEGTLYSISPFFFPIAATPRWSTGIFLQPFHNKRIIYKVRKKKSIDPCSFRGSLLEQAWTTVSDCRALNLSRAGTHWRRFFFFPWLADPHL